METSKKRLRRDYAPMSVAVSVACDSAGSPLMQVFNSDLCTYQPNRQITATILRPTVSASASDGSIGTPLGVEAVGDMKWYVNGEDITTVDGWKDMYTIYTNGDDRGKLAIRRNVEVGEQFALRFEGKLYDSRTGQTLPIVSDEVNIGTTPSGDDAFGACIDTDPSLIYNPVLDKLLVYDWRVAHGEMAASDKAEAAATDHTAYLRRIGISLFRGRKLYTGTDVTAKIYSVGSASGGGVTLTEIDTDDAGCEIVELDAGHVDIDLRLVESRTYYVKLLREDNEVASVQFTVTRAHPSFHAEPANGGDFMATDTQHYNEAMLSSGGKVISCPSAAFDIAWKTDTALKTAMSWGEGATALIDLEEAGVGVDYDDSWMDIYLEARQRGAYSVATDENGDVLTDENGQELIID